MSPASGKQFKIRVQNVQIMGFEPLTDITMSALNLAAHESLFFEYSEKEFGCYGL